MLLERQFLHLALDEVWLDGGEEQRGELLGGGGGRGGRSHTLRPLHLLLLLLAPLAEAGARLVPGALTRSSC
jgi:hypothetical protein